MNTTIHDMSAVRPHLTVTFGARKSSLPNTVHFDGRWWWFTVPGEGTVAARDSKQIRALIAMLLNKNQVVDVEYIVKAAMTGQMPLCRKVTFEKMSELTSNAMSELYKVLSPIQPDLPSFIDPQEQWKSACDFDLLNSLGGEMSHHTGDAGDMHTVREIDRRVAKLNKGIALETARGNLQKAADLEEERSALKSFRNWYINPVTGRLRLFYTEFDEKKFKRARMWIVRGLQSLAAMGLPLAVARLNPAIERGMEFIFNEDPNWEWIVTPAPKGSLRHLGNKTDKPDNQEGDGSMAAA